MGLENGPGYFIIHYSFPIIKVSSSSIMYSYKLEKYNLDPFNLNHNVAAGISQKKFQYIMACFTEGRKRFGDPGQKVPGHVNLIDYFFDKDVLTPYSYMPNNRYDIFFRELNIKNSARTIPKEVFLFFFKDPVRHL